MIEFSRRSLLSAATIAALLGSPIPVFAEAVLPDPHVSALRHGALIWVRGEEQWVPYSSDAEAERFEADFDVALERNPKLLTNSLNLEELRLKSSIALTFSTSHWMGRKIFPAKKAFSELVMLP